MFDSFVPDVAKPFDSCVNPSGTGFGNLEPIDSITPQSALKNLIAGGGSKAEISPALPTAGGDDSIILLNKSLLSLNADVVTQTSSNSCQQAESLSVDSLTGVAISPEPNSDLHFLPIVQEAVQKVRDALTGLAADPDFDAKMNVAFGDNFDTKVAREIVEKFAKGDFSELPQIEILPSVVINGANGAFAKETNTVYLASDFVAKNANNSEAIASVLLEENGHYIDSQINIKDAAGDEGDIFARVVQGKNISASELAALKAEDDRATVTFDGKDIQIEQAKSFAAGDRVIDIIRQERGSWVDKSRDAEVVLSKGDWTFNQPTGLPNMDAMNGDFVNLITGDFDGNGLTDFIRQEKGSWVNGVNDAQVYLATGKGTFKSPIQMTDMAAMNGNFVNLVAGDFNGDFKTDIIRQEKGTWIDGYRDAEIYISNGDGTFKNPVLMNNASAMNGNFVNLIVGDFTGGGADDIIRQEKGNWVDGNNDVQYYTFSQGNFKFQANLPNMGAMNGNFVNLVAGDFNGDRVTDLIRQEKGSWGDGNRDAEICISNGTWGFKSITTMNNASVMNGDYVNLIVGDLTGGGADDIIRQEKGNWVNGSNDVEFLTYSNSNFVKVKDAPNMSELNGNYVTLVPGLFGTSSGINSTGNTLPNSTQQADPFFKLQYWNSKYNPDGPNSSTNCGPASLAMVMKTLGREPANISTETSIDYARYLMFGYSNGTKQGVPVLDQDNVWTNFDQVKAGIQKAGGIAEQLTGWDALDRSLNAEKPVISFGNLTNAWRQQFPNRVGSGSGGHWNAILGKTSDGKYIVADPMHEGGAVAMTRNQLAVFTYNGYPEFIAFARN
ncbi:C39 family peptidase [Planktothrix sp. FACHB-1355]|uniref:C39 family peptidase n=1 Tax=Aerosakkonema funiforme FACHB-1375 TaxID=2949571 RepID=A0A926VBE2_9CYAN|nr:MULTISPECIES: C39 family peptidase [Oscillatoriales]MBD2180580.1 C39 family peptidase [Aerosakkonema funiforme FACHB-1375]MBD3559778.1 C39 family peptidase [Planktothrix sp. FACHB-1355]